MLTAQLFADDALLSEVADAAAARGWHVITNGQRMVVSPIVPPGYTKVAVKTKPEALPCAA